MILRVATLAGDPEAEAVLAPQLGLREDVEVALRCIDRVEILAALRARDVDAVIAVGAPGWLDGQISAEAEAAGVRLVGLADNSLEAEQLRLHGMKVLEGRADLREIVRACRTAAPPDPARVQMRGPRGRGRLFAVWGAKGAPGRTTIACELGATLALDEPETLLIDADPYGGDALQLLGVTEEVPSVVWAASLAARDRLSRIEIDAALRRVGRKGPVLLPGLPRGELWPEISQLGWTRLLAAARDNFKVVVCDVGFCLEEPVSPLPIPAEGRNRMTRQTLMEADRVIAVCRADPIGIKNFIWAYTELTEIVEAERVVIVANRARPTERSDVAEVLRRHTGKRPACYIADRPAELARAVVSGQTVTEMRPGSDVCTAVRDLASSLGGEVRARGLLSKLAGSAS